jgi:hypothetical protein
MKTIFRCTSGTCMNDQHDRHSIMRNAVTVQPEIACHRTARFSPPARQVRHSVASGKVEVGALPGAPQAALVIAAHSACSGQIIPIAGPQPRNAL